jgi:hypothetical protein
VGLNLFSGDKELFWVRFPQSAGALQELSGMVESAALRPRVSEIRFLEQDVREAFSKLHSRRVVGKQVIRIADDLR